MKGEKENLGARSKSVYAEGRSKNLSQSIWLGNSKINYAVKELCCPRSKTALPPIETLTGSSTPPPKVSNVSANKVSTFDASPIEVLQLTRKIYTQKYA